jgi:hypothetical protein
MFKTIDNFETKAGSVFLSEITHIKGNWVQNIEKPFDVTWEFVNDQMRFKRFEKLEDAQKKFKEIESVLMNRGEVV